VNGVSFVTALGLGCIALIYALGTLLYGKTTGLVAAILFGLVPWQVFMARTYLIDVQYMFLSLLFLVFGILAVKQNSQKILAASGVLFALAFLTKLFAVFLLIPLLLTVLLKGKESGFKLNLRNVLVFLAPSFIFQAIWFGGFANQHFFGVYVASDLTHPVLIANPSLTFLPRIFVEGAGWFLPAAAVLSLILAIVFRRLFSRILWVDIVCVLTIVAVAGVDLSLVFGRHLLVPYVSAFKYDYAALPFVCLLAASLTDKVRLLGSLGKSKVKLLLVGLVMFLLSASLVESILFLNHSEPYPLIDFKVDYVGHYFPFNVFTPVSSYFQLWHYLAVALIVLSLTAPYVWVYLKKKISWLMMVLSS
jgi:4-amino-4-deoxy-L-arabinose transferase-like glycosyltransferase